MDHWYYSDGVEAQGPCRLHDLAAWIREGLLSREVSVWCEGRDWTPASAVPELAALLPLAQPRAGGDGRRHRPFLALAAALALPGAGQAYNGQPGKALVFLFSWPLALPWIWSVVDAWRVASRVVAEGGRFGRGGCLWVMIQGWAALNLAILVALVLTLGGWLR